MLLAARQPVRSTSAPTRCWCRTPRTSWPDIRRLVQTLDVPVKQVLIEARIVIVSDTFERDLGARFGVTTAQQNGTNGLLSVTGNGVGADTMTNSAHRAIWPRAARSRR